MITCFHFVRLSDPAQREGVVRELQAALGPDDVVGRPLDAHAEAAWCLSIRLHGPDHDALAKRSAVVGEVLGDRATVHKSWSFRERS